MGVLINPNNVEQKVHPSYLCFHFDQGQKAVLACPYHSKRSVAHPCLPLVWQGDMMLQGVSDLWQGDANVIVS